METAACGSSSSTLCMVTLPVCRALSKAKSDIKSSFDSTLEAQDVAKQRIMSERQTIDILLFLYII